MRGSTKSCNNRASAIYASSALLVFQEYTSVEFSNNVGSKGGAIFLAGDSRILVYDDTALKFTNNTASYGGAICSLFSDISITYGDSCFLVPKEKAIKTLALILLAIHHLRRLAMTFLCHLLLRAAIFVIADFFNAISFPVSACYF